MAHRVALSCPVFLVSLISFAAMATSEECLYVVRVKTGDRTDAGTDSTISLKLQSATGNSFTVNNLEDWGIMEPGHDYFNLNNLDVFMGRGSCLNVCAINVTSNGKGNGPGWYLDYVEVIVSGNIFGKVAFLVDRWLSLGEKPNGLYADINLCATLPPRFL